jgi:hypothetical protein
VQRLDPKQLPAGIDAAAAAAAGLAAAGLDDLAAEPAVSFGEPAGEFHTVVANQGMQMDQQQGRDCMEECEGATRPQGTLDGVLSPPLSAQQALRMRTVGSLKFSTPCRCLMHQTTVDIPL